MKAIQMVDLQTQYLEIKAEIDQGIQDVLNTSFYIGGPKVKSFTENLAQFLDVKHVIPCANGTDALQIALMALDLQPGDEVITTAFTFVATAEVIALLGLVPVFVDINPDTFLMDEHLVENLITPKTKCIIPVHLFGQGVNMELIMNIATKHNLYVIEDNAQAIGASFTNSQKIAHKYGSIGHIGCTSFFPSKNLGCYGDGGALFTNDDQFAEKLSLIANHGSKVRYYHSAVGINSRLDAIQAAILDVKLKRLEEYNNKRKHAAQLYTDGLKGIPQISTPFSAEHSTHVYHQYTIKAEKRDDLAKFLTKNNIPYGIYYPVPLHQQEAYKEYYKQPLPHTESVVKDVISLPMHTELTEEQIQYIINTIKEFFA